MTDSLYDDGEIYDLAHGARADEAQVAFYAELARAHGGECLELGSGTGRVSVPMAQQGIRVTGIDLAEPMVSLARRKAAEAGVSCEWVFADFRSFDLGRRFGLIMVPINTIAHLPTRPDFEACMARVRAHLAPGGRFVIDYFIPNLTILDHNPEEPRASYDLHGPEGEVVLSVAENNAFEPIAQINYIEWVCRRPDGTTFEKRFSMRIFFPAELEALLHYNGLEIVERYADFERSPLTLSAHRQVLVCRAREGSAAS